MDAESDSERAITFDATSSKENDVTKCSDKNSPVRAFMNTEYNSLRNEINQYKTGQITLFTATASATGIMLGLFVNLMINQKSDLFICAILILLPLMVILPSSWMYFEKAIKINRLEAYCTAYAKNFLYAPLKYYHYFGYSEYKRQYLDSLASHGKISNSEVDNEYKKGSVSIIEKIVTYWIFKEESSYWRNSFYAYFGLELICILVFGVFFLSNTSDERSIYAVFEPIGTYYEIFLSVLLAAMIFGLKKFWNLFRGPKNQSIEFIHYIICLLILWLGVFALFRYGQIVLGFILFVCSLLGLFFRIIFFRTGSCDIGAEKPSYDIFLYLVSVLSIIMIYTIEVVLPCISRQISSIQCFAIIFISIFLFSSVWKLVTVSSILFGKYSYEMALDRWEYIIKTLMLTPEDDSKVTDAGEDYPSLKIETEDD